MTRLAQLFILAAVLTFGGASICQKTPVTNPVVAGVVNCAEAGVNEAAIHIIDDAASALATGEYVAALEDLVKRFGEAALDCAVAEIANTAGAHAALDELEAVKAKRAKAWLASRPVTLSQSPKHGFCPWGVCIDDDVMSVAVVAPTGMAPSAWPMMSEEIRAYCHTRGLRCCEVMINGAFGSVCLNHDDMSELASPLAQLDFWYALGT